MNRFEFDDSLKKQFETLKRVPAPVNAVQNLYRKLSDKNVSRKPRRGALWSRYGRKKVVLAVALTLLITVPVTFFITRQITNSSTETKYIVRFIYRDENAKSVEIIGDFNNWGGKTIKMSRVRDSHFWTADVTLPEGIYQYVFLVNGTAWIVDPLSRISVKDNYGNQNSLIVLLGDEDADRKL